MAKTPKIEYLTQTFEPRNLPTVIWLRDEAIVGPFCIHCGWPFTLHGPRLECRRQVFTFLGPACKCHRVETDRQMETRVAAERSTPVRRSRRR